MHIRKAPINSILVSYSHRESLQIGIVQSLRMGIGSG
jgi:hypothetical protein